MENPTHSTKRAAPVEPESLRVVGIGASAGGLGALRDLFQAMGGRTQLAFVVVQHLAPDHPSLMPEILAKHTDMPVCQAQDGQRIEPNHVYLIPPRQELTIVDDKLVLKARSLSRGGVYLPIDTFFRSLAREKGKQAIGIILSGSGSDGTRGAMAIKDAGGMVMVHDPEAAEFDGMPRSVIASGCQDFILAPARMPDALQDYIRHPFSQTPPVPLDDLSGQQQYERVLDLIRRQTRLDLSEYKRNTIIRRIARRMNICRVEELPAYLELLSVDPEEVEHLSREVLIGVTSFFRDKEAFEILQRRVIPGLVEKIEPDRPLRVWDVGCASGEEAYSLAILLHEALAEYDDGRSAKIFATDLNAEAIDFACKGIFPESIVGELSAQRIERCFDRVMGGRFRVKPEIRKMVVFARHNALVEPPFTKVHLICCRNMTIYLQASAQKRLARAFSYALLPGGYLFLGPSESLGGQGGQFRSIDKRWKIYQNAGGGRSSLREYRSELANAHAESRTGLQRLSPLENKHSDEYMTESLCNALTRDYVPAAVAVNRDNEIVHIFGDVSGYLHLPTGSAKLHLYEMLPRQLSAMVSAGLHRCRQGRKDVVMGGVEFQDARGNHGKVDLRFRNVWDPRISSHFALIFFESTCDAESPKRVDRDQLDPEDQSRLASLEHDLRQTRENLQATMEEMETSNEELQATNEELVVSNEELQSTNEELQSVNEELHTVNAEYQEKIEELIQLNDDMDNLLRTSEVGTLFLDNRMQIRKFTPAVRNHFHLLGQDVGRPFAHITHDLEFPELAEKIETCMRTGRREEQEVPAETGKSVLVRIDPYLPSAGDGPVGAVITLVDVTEIRNAQAAQHAAEQRFRNTFDLASVAIAYVSGEDGRFLHVNPALCRMLGYTREELLARTFQDVSHPDDSDKGQELFENLRTGRQEEGTLDKRYLHKDGQEVFCRLHTRYLSGENCCLTILEDITDQREQEWLMRHLAAVVNSSDDAIFSKDLNGSILSWNRGAEKLYGYTAAEAIGQNVSMLFIPEQLDQLARTLQQVRDGQTVSHPRCVRRTKDGRDIEVSVRITPVRDEEGRIFAAAATARDIRHISALQHRLDRQSEISDAILESADAPICLLDAQGRFRRFNAGCEKVSGLSRAQVLDKPFWDMVLPADQKDQVTEYFQRIVEGEEVSTHRNDWLTADGRRVTIQWRNLILRDDHAQAVYILCIGQTDASGSP